MIVLTPIPLDPHQATSVVVKTGGSGLRAPFLGTCFAYKHGSCFITAAHCIGDLEPRQISVTRPGRAFGFPAEDVRVHETADIAIVHIPLVEKNEEVFRSIGPSPGWGDDVTAFGYPEDDYDPQGRRPTPRIFRGHIQRLMHYRSQFGYSYEAGELNIAAPGGLSGGPVFSPNVPTQVIGVVTENFLSTTFPQEVESVLEEGRRVAVSRVDRVINYGICVLLSDVAAWIDAETQSLLADR